MGLLAAMRRAKGGIGRVAVALALAFFALAPAVDAMSCAGDGELHAAAVSTLDSPGAAASGVDRSDHGDSGPGDAACAHGHCHHNMAFGSAAIPQPAAPVKLARVGGPPLTVQPPSFDPSGLERPPRA